MASKLRYDTEAMRTAATKYEGQASAMLKIKEDLNDSIKNLVTEQWRSKAGAAFEETYSADWGQNVDKYVSVLNELAEMLRTSANQYDAVTRVAERIRF